MVDKYVKEGDSIKVQIEKDHYDQIQKAEKSIGMKIEDLTMIVPECINGIWGAYQITGYYRTKSCYFAEMNLLERAESEIEAFLKAKKVANKLQKK